MKLIRKNINPLEDNKGETIVEVVVAFTVLSIMMVLFSQGIAYASRIGIRADQNRDSADQAMMDLQEQIAGNITPPGKLPVPADVPNDIESFVVYRQVYSVDSKTYVVYSSSVS